MEGQYDRTNSVANRVEIVSLLFIPECLCASVCFSAANFTTLLYLLFLHGEMKCFERVRALGQPGQKNILYTLFQQ
jgi:hypothetical protein